MRSLEHLPSRESMKVGHRVRKFRRGNVEHNRGHLARKQKPWKNHNTLRSAA